VKLPIIVVNLPRPIANLNRNVVEAVYHSPEDAMFLIVIFKLCIVVLMLLTTIFESYLHGFY
jgi:hypothetical protein